MSTATVSRALSRPEVVADSTRTAVLEAVQRTGYRINATASNLRRQRTGSVFALVPNLSNPFFSRILAGLTSVLTPAGYGLLVADTQTGPDPEARLQGYLTSGLADGLVLLDGALATQAEATPGRPPVVMACEWGTGALPSVRVDNAHGAQLAVDHLADLGHRHIGHITGPRGNVLTETRLEGFRRATKARGLEPPWMQGGDFTLASGAAAAQAWLDLPRRPTAVFAASDQMAVGFMGALHRAGLSVPGDVSVVGFDNIDVAHHLTPGLTTVRQYRNQIGEQSAAMLLRLIESGDDLCPSEIVPVEFIQRESTAPLR